MFPGWFAVTSQLPAPVMVTWVPRTEQLPVTENSTVRPEFAVAETVNGASPNVLAARGPKVIVCDACATLSVPSALGAA